MDPVTVLVRMLDIISFPFEYPDILPSLAPIIVGMIVLELYFGRYTHEELGWNTAVGNATMLVTTGIVLLLELDLATEIGSSEARVAFLIIMTGLVILTFDFYHIWPKTLAFNMSSAFVMYLLAYYAIFLGYSDTPITQETGAALVIFFLLLLGIFEWVKGMEVSADVGEELDNTATA